MNQQNRFGNAGGKYKNAHSIAMGTRAEIAFENLMKQHGLRAERTKGEDDWKNHFDYVVKGTLFGEFINEKTKENETKVEVKAMKAKKRYEEQSPGILIVETIGTSGFPGWVFGESDIIAFEFPDNRFMLMKTKELAEYTQRVSTDFPKAPNCETANTRYSRISRPKEEIVIFDTKEIMKKVPNIILGAPPQRKRQRVDEQEEKVVEEKKD